MNVFRSLRLGAWLLALLLPLAAQAHDTPMPIRNTEGGSPVAAVSAGNSHSCGIKADGSVACWGDNGYGQTNTPAGAFLSVSAGAWHTCGIKSDGSVACWGYNSDGQSNAPAGAFLSVSAGSYHSCGVKADGSVACWGYNSYGQTNAPAGAFLSVSAGGIHSCGVKADGSVACWGDNSYGQANAPAGAFLSVSSANSHTCGVKADGSVTCWGSNSIGQSNAPAGALLSVSAGIYHSCGVKADGSVACWGYNGYGQTTVPATLGQVGFGQITAGNAHTCQVKRDGTLSCWGLNTNGQTTAPAGLFTQVANGTSHSCGLRPDGTVACWGLNAADNQLVFGANQYKTVALADSGRTCAQRSTTDQLDCYRGVPAIGFAQWGGFGFKQISAGGTRTCGVSASGLGTCAVNMAFEFLFTGSWQRIEAGLDHACGLKPDGSLACWGDNSLGQTTGVPTGSIRAFSVGYNHACAIKADGTLACWGSNVSGQATAPAGTFVQVAAGNTFTCAIRSDGVRLCWGDDAHGQAPQLALSPTGVPGGQVSVAYAGANFSLTDASPTANALEPYTSPTPAFVVVAGSLPPGLTLAANGQLIGTPTAGGNFNFTVEGEDANGFMAGHAYMVNILADSTPPVIAYTLNGAAPGSDPTAWYTSDVALAWSVTDPESSISSMTGCVDESLNTDTSGTTRSCTASSAGGSGNLTTVSIRRDATAPTLAPSVPNPLLRGQSYSASPNASDATSGVASQSCGALDTSSLGNKSTTCNATDNAGNSITVPLNYTVTTTCANDGYKGTQLSWCVQICESGLTGRALDDWIHRWFRQFHNYPYCVAPQQTLGLQH